MRYAVAITIGIALLALSTDGPRAQQVGAEPSAASAPQATLQRRIPDTLMFSIDELNDIRSRAASGEAAQTDSRDAIEDAALYLSTILYYGSDSWTIWVNDKPITSAQEIKSFEVSDIGPDFVELRVPLSAQGMRPIRLAPNQTFVVRSGAVVEGRWSR